MIKIKQISLFTFLFFLIACNTDDGGNDIDESPMANLSASIDGNIFEAQNITAVLSNDGERLVIIGNNGSESLMITLGTEFENLEPVQEQTYILDGNSVGTVTYSIQGEQYLNRVDVSGAFITIASLDLSNTEISGSFSASVSTIDDPAVLLVSNGLFENINFTVE